MKIALITGVSRKEGIGFETARQLGLKNYKVVIAARQLGKASALCSELILLGIDADAVEMDLTDEASVGAASKQLEAKYGRIDVLINNAAVMLHSTATIAGKDLAELSQELETNITGTWRVTQYILPLLIKSDHGRIVNISSTMGSITEPGWGLLDYSRGPIPAYSITKLALNGLTIKMAKEFKDHHILVNAVCPGFTATYPEMEEMGARPVRESVEGVVWAATLEDDGPTGEFFRDKKAVAW
ncbi:SDR family NAD(P)-dependent oxidoreductase [Dyadobacter subterraneus]|uniref:SDR family NAD(P)-dependent oxidoreductase n=1 Tax=Dyadobacter subterraneus TaxID=2773304 RepID=A0ABR9WB01_9BACT|nr:SDR family NAD(P)-dependent oxidoreductase [Dyadobacter subterraneus]MBE9462151.1 SDR family NAD(P)-dependent oxidoreductase [Dyadobacter subterraneus]